MKLKELLQGINVLACTADLETEIASVAYDSRKVEKDSLFVAISGFTSDGNRFIPMAMEKGAAVVVTAKKPKVDVPYVLVDNDRLALAVLGTNFYGKPAESMTMIGITGTNGKTSVTLLLKQVLESVLGAKVGLIDAQIRQTRLDDRQSYELVRDIGCIRRVFPRAKMLWRENNRTGVFHSSSMRLRH